VPFLDPFKVLCLRTGKLGVSKGHSAAMLVEESSAFQVATFHTLRLYRSELDQDQLLLDVMVIADEGV
jgi:hypothetical protein